MQTEKLSISLPAALMQFIEDYKQAHHCKSRTVVIEEAIELLRQKELENAYREASREVDPDWEATTMDGLADETW